MIDNTIESASPCTGFDHHDPELATRIHEQYAAMRAEGPIGWSEKHDGFWVATSWHAVRELARDSEALSSSGSFIPNVLGDNVLIPISLDPPEHSKYRKLLQRWFTTGRTATFGSVIRERSRQLIDRLESPADLCEGFARPLPLDVILLVIGVPDRDMEPVAAGARAAIDGLAEDPVAAFAAIQGAYDYLETELVPALRARPGDDLISYLAAAEVDDGPLADGTIAAIAFNVVGAGFDTTFKTLSSSLAFLAQDQEAQRRLRDGADMSKAVDELIRLFAPVTAGRKVVDERAVDGATMKPGDSVLLAFPAACRDPEIFPNPDAADFSRAPNKHIAFGSGIHLCLGMHLARLELATALDELLAAFASFELAPGATPQYSQSQVWGATSVPVSFQRQ